ncbi:hypothetical protein ACP70R_012811 [Stipagrostis hirtigluma subsp. patula]
MALRTGKTTGSPAWTRTTPHRRLHTTKGVRLLGWERARRPPRRLGRHGASSLPPPRVPRRRRRLYLPRLPRLSSSHHRSPTHCSGTHASGRRFARRDTAAVNELLRSRYVQRLMAEIDTRPLESAQAAVTTHFEPSTDQHRLRPDINEEEIVILSKELATCKLQLEVKENENKQAIIKIEALQKAVQELSERYDVACLDARRRISQLEAENAAIAARQSAAAEECRDLRAELAAVHGELEAARASIGLAVREVELTEARAVAERENTREALARILQLNETVLSSAVAAVRAEEERSVFFQEVTMELFNSDKNLEVIRRQVEAMETMERELLAKTVEIEYLRSELKLVKELYVSPQEDSDATAVAAGCQNSSDRQVQDRETAVNDQEPEAEFTFQNAPEECFVSEIFRKDSQFVLSDGAKVQIMVPEDEDVVEGKERADGMAPETELEGKSDARATRCLAGKIAGEDHHAVQPAGESTEAENNHEQEADGETDGHQQDHEEPKADASFVLESSRDDDFQSVRSDDKDNSVAMPVNDAGAQEPRGEAAAPASAPRKADPDTGLVATEIGVSNDDGEFYTKELEPERGQAGGKLEGHVLVAKGAAAAAAGVTNDKQLDAARAEISDLRFSLEEAVRRAELAEEAKASLERELREEIRKKHTTRRRAASFSEDAIRPAPERAPPTLTRPRPTPRCLTLGKVLSMKYK